MRCSHASNYAGKFRFGPGQNTAGILAIIAGSVLLATASSFVFPVFEGPDECWHFEYARRLAQGKGLPDQRVPSRSVPTQGFNPPGPYVLPAAVLAWTDRERGAGVTRLPPLLWLDEDLAGRAGKGASVPPLNPQFHRFGKGTAPNLFCHPAAGPFASGPLWSVHLMRLCSVASGAAVLLSIWGLARAVFPERPSAQAVAVALVAFNPKFIHLSGTLNNDIPAALFGSLILWQLAAHLRRERLSDVATLALGATLGLGILAKPNVLFLLAPVTGVLWWLRRSASTFLRQMALLGLIVLCLGGWFYVRNAYLYGHLDFFGWKLRMASERIFVVPEECRWPMLWRELMPMLLQTSWDRFAWGEVRLPAWLTAFYCSLAVLVPFSYPALRRSPWPVIERRLAVLLWATVLLNLSSVVWFSLQFTGNQGRYLYPSVGAIAVLMAVTVEIISADMPTGKRRWIPAVLILSLAGLAVYALVGVIAPVYSVPAVS